MIEVLSWITDFVCLAAQWRTGNKTIFRLVLVLVVARAILLGLHLAGIVK